MKAVPNDTIVVQFDTVPIAVKKITDQELEDYYQDADFVYEELPIGTSEWDNFKSWLGDVIEQFFEYVFGSDRGRDFFRGFIKILPYVLFLVFAYLVFWFFFKVSSSGIISSNKNKNTVHRTEEERIIKSENIEQLIQEAIQNQAYRLAIRYHYLNVLKSLIESGLINWEIQKTNEDYLKELHETQLSKGFVEITRIYDYTWYGEFEIEGDKYHLLEEPFITIQKSIATHVK